MIFGIEALSGGAQCPAILSLATMGETRSAGPPLVISGSAGDEIGSN